MVHLRIKAVVASKVKSPIQSRTLNQRVITSLGEKSPRPSHRRLLCSQNQQKMSLFTRKHWTGWGVSCWVLVTEHTPLPPVATVSIGCKPVTYLAFLKPSLLSGRRLKITQGPGGNVGHVAQRGTEGSIARETLLHIPMLLLPSWWTLGTLCPLSGGHFPCP